MISAQIDELREWADQLSERENEFGVVVRALVAALRDAADTIWQLRDDLQRANAENAKLREERDMYRDLVGCMVHPDIPDQLYAENAKLRELVRDMMQAWWACDNEKCPRHDERCEKGRYCAFDECVRDLGVEVDE